MLKSLMGKNISTKHGTQLLMETFPVYLSLQITGRCTMKSPVWHLFYIFFFNNNILHYWILNTNQISLLQKYQYRFIAIRTLIIYMINVTSMATSIRDDYWQLEVIHILSVSDVNKVMKSVGDSTCPPGILPSCHDRRASSSESLAVMAIFSPVGRWPCWMDLHCCTSRKAAHLKTSRQSWRARLCPDHSALLLDVHYLKKKKTLHEFYRGIKVDECINVLVCIGSKVRWSACRSSLVWWCAIWDAANVIFFFFFAFVTIAFYQSILYTKCSELLAPWQEV